MRGRRLLLPLGALFVVVGAGLLGDWYAQNREMDRLLRGIEAAEGTINRFNPTTQSIFDEYLGRGPIPQEERDVLFARVGKAAADSQVEVTARVERVSQIRFLPWHRDLARARDRYVHHAGIWLAYLRDVARDAEANYPKRSPQILATYLDALEDLRRAAPARSRQDFEARIKALEPN